MWTPKGLIYSNSSEHIQCKTQKKKVYPSVGWEGARFWVGGTIGYQNDTKTAPHKVEFYLFYNVTGLLVS